MQAMSACAPVRDIRGEPGTHAGGMLERVRKVMASLTDHEMSAIYIQDLLAVDTFIPRKVQGGMAGECAMENAVGMAAMVKADRLQMQVIARELSARLQTEVVVGGVEANMAIAGALTTPGCAAPLAILDLGAGSTDAAIVNAEGQITAVHLAGAGNMVSLLIKTELGLEDLSLAEAIKKYPLAKVESLFSIRHENGAVEFFREALSPAVFAKVVYIKEGELVPIDNASPLEKIRLVRRQAKEKVFVTNCLRALRQVSPGGSIRDIAFVVLVGGSSLDFEIPQLITEALSHYGVVAGQGNIRGTEGPRNAVATRAATGRSGELNGRSRQPLSLTCYFRMPIMNQTSTLTGQCVAEFLGTGLLIFFGAGCVAALRVAGASFGQWEISIIWGLGVAMAIYLTAGVSGAHLNPAVTIALWLFACFERRKVLPFIVAQTAGAFCAAALVYGLYRQLFLDLEQSQHIVRGTAASLNLAGVFSTYPHPHITFIQAFAVETTITAILMAMIMALTDDGNGIPRGPLAPLLIGLLIAVIGASMGPLTGFALNPARDFGPKLFTSLAGWGSIAFTGGLAIPYFLVPLLAPVVGAIIGAFLYRKLIGRHLPCECGIDE